MWIEHLPGFNTSLLRCSNGHDHSSWPVVGLIAERARGYGKTARPGVHCPECSVLTRSDVQSDPRPFANIADADVLGNFMPCGSCFKTLHAFVVSCVTGEPR
jgi:hypothetical protein